MDNDEQDPDLVAERWFASHRNVVIRQRNSAWDEPYSEDEHKCIRCGEMRSIDRPDGCEDFLCP